MSDVPDGTSHGDRIAGGRAFASQRQRWRRSLGADEDLRSRAVELQVCAEEHRYTYTWEWLGVPVIRLPDDIVVLQEIIWSYRPQAIVETGVARGGSMVLNASLQHLSGVEPRVLGIDLEILRHTHDALAEHPYASGVTLREDDSTTTETQEAARAFLAGTERAMLVLDSNHTHDHVLAELRSLAKLLPVGGLVLVADTLIEEFPAGHYANRPWDRGNNPLTAIEAFLAADTDFVREEGWSRRGLLSEFRDGILRRVR